jgi:hypothetical protein
MNDRESYDAWARARRASSRLRNMAPSPGVTKIKTAAGVRVVVRLGSATSRNAREGSYAGQFQGRHLRTKAPPHGLPTPDSDAAWFLASRRAGVYLLTHHPRYVAKAER